MEDLKIEKFNPTIAELNKLVSESQSVDVSNLILVKATRLNLRDARVAISKQGKEFRQQALDFQKIVISKEKELIAIIEPEETRLEKIEAEAKEKEEREKRMALLPKRKERLSAIGDSVEISDENILEMDGPEFEGYCNKRFAEKNEADRKVLEEKQRIVKEQEERLAREKEMREREEKVRQEEKEKHELAEKARIEREKKAEQDRKEREIKEAQEKIERDEREKKAAEKALAKDKKYQKFLKDNGWSKETKDDFIIQNFGDTVVLFKKVGEINL